MTKFLCLAGSSRKESFNKKLAKCAFEELKAQGADAQFVDLHDYPMPLFNEDDEASTGMPENALKLKKIFIKTDGFFIASPEYNSSISPLLKNTMDWISRTHEEGEPALKAYKGKVFAIGGASPGGFGGMRGLVHLRMILQNMGAHTIPSQISVPSSFKEFDEHGHFVQEKYAKMLKGMMGELIDMTQRLG